MEDLTRTELWKKIQDDYMNGLNEKQLALKYNMLPLTIGNRIKKLNLSGMRARMLPDVKKQIIDSTKILVDNDISVKNRVDKLTLLALHRLEERLNDMYLDDAMLDRFIGRVIDISGLKQDKTDHTVTVLPVVNKIYK